MPIDPQIVAMLAAMPEWPGVRHVPLDILRQSVRDSSIAIPAAQDAVVAHTEDRTISGPGGSADEATLPIRIYTPLGEAPFPVVVYMHGGGFVVGDLDTQDMIARALCAWSESIVISVDYRLAPEHKFPAGVDDSFAALQWAASNAATIGGDPARLGLAGDSAGANIACAAALIARDAGGPVVRAVVNIYGSCNYPGTATPSAAEFADGPILRADDVLWFWEQYLSDPSQQDDQRASPLRATSHAGLPPHFVGTAECDPTRDDAEVFAGKLVEAGVVTQLKRYPGMVHGFASWVGFLPGARAVLQDASAFLKTHLSD
ncbi:alpha/beta hydrolase fold domain-containing protein [Novosphingobium sp. FKTRR1]|uniref:alpha/beta hydrolase fold domain-containing protein n=1 Tax=Novosphingobium sp. FKTRR1 TaxID=2879118 RepID=UPI001CF01A1F|nr:alpha/beta hydrolase [Novosphingobium sp. FKTRR1]